MDDQQQLNVIELLSDLAAREITIWLEDEQLRYRAPKAALTAQLVSTLKLHKAELIGWLRQRAALRRVTRCTRWRRGTRPVLEWQLDPHSTRYHLTSVDRLPAAVNIETLHKAAQALIERHPILRTIYPLPDDPGATQPVQQVQVGAAVDFEVVDGTAWAQPQIDAWIAQTADRPFDLIHGPVMRMAVLRTLDRAGHVVHLLHWALHHIATDYFSQEVLRHDFAACYEALRQGRQPEPTRTLSYHDFVRWERDVLQAQGERMAAFWRSYLHGEVTRLNLPTLPTEHQAEPRARSATRSRWIRNSYRSCARWRGSIKRPCIRCCWLRMRCC